jgi:phage FluMu protein Com
MKYHSQIKCNTCGKLFYPIVTKDGIEITCPPCKPVYKTTKRVFTGLQFINREKI